MSLIVAWSLLLQETTAEETFKKIEELGQKAKTVSIRFNCETVRGAGGKEVKTEVKGTLLLKDANKVNHMMTVATVRGDNRRAFDVTDISDGARMASKNGNSPLQDKETPKTLKAAWTILFVRYGGFGAGLIGRLVSNKQDLDGLKAEYEVSNFKSGEDDKDAKTLTHTLTIASPKATYDAKLWYDAKTLKPLRRTFRDASKADASTVSETYEEFALEGDIPDEKFKLPADK